MLALPSPWIPSLYKKMTKQKRAKLNSDGIVVKKIDKQSGKVKVSVAQGCFGARVDAEAWRTLVEGHAGVPSQVCWQGAQAAQALQGLGLTTPCLGD